MTEEDLLKKIDTWGVDHIAITGIKDCVRQFFESNICIPKGVNRHPDADVLHTLVEDTSLRYEVQENTDIGFYNDDNFNQNLYEYRIKPSELVYLYRFTYQDYDGTVAISDYLSEKDAIISLVDVSNVSKLEWTKRAHNA